MAKGTAKSRFTENGGHKPMPAPLEHGKATAAKSGLAASQGKVTGEPTQWPKDKAMAPNGGC